MINFSPELQLNFASALLSVSHKHFYSPKQYNNYGAKKVSGLGVHEI